MNPEITTGFKKLQLTTNRQLCPECGASMTLVDWRNENGTMFMWYGCRRNGCNGQWLKRMDITSSRMKKVV